MMSDLIIEEGLRDKLKKFMVLSVFFIILDQKDLQDQVI